MTKHKRYWWRVEGKIVYGEWTGCYAPTTRLMWMRTLEGELWSVPLREIMSEDKSDWSY